MLRSFKEGDLSGLGPFGLVRGSQVVKERSKGRAREASDDREVR